MQGRNIVSRIESEDGTRRAEPDQCRHHWFIQSPEGPTSLGRCKHCGAEREFPNSGSDFVWEDDATADYKPSRFRSVLDLTDQDSLAASTRSGDAAALVV